MTIMADPRDTTGRKARRRPGDSEMHRRKRTKNLVVLGLLVGFVVLFYVLSIVRMGGGA